jgi:hypothetical protein
MPDDDNLMERFDENARRFRARDGVFAIVVAALVLVAIQGSSMHATGEQLNDGAQRDVVLAVAKPAGWIARRSSLHRVSDRLRKELSPDAQLGSGGGFDTQARTVAGGTALVPAVTPDAYDAKALGARPVARRQLHTLLITGDSLSTPLDLELARRLTGRGVKVLREPHLGSGISKTDLVDWGKLSTAQTKKDRPNAVVVFIGANEGFPMTDPAGHSQSCCGAAWASIYANRARQMMNTYRRGGATRVYWITVPTPREASHARIQRVVNAAIEVAAQPWRSQVEVVDTVPVFTPGAKYRDAMTVGGRKTIVREPDGIHLNPAGSGLLAGILINDLKAAFRY